MLFASIQLHAQTVNEPNQDRPFSTAGDKIDDTKVLLDNKPTRSISQQTLPSTRQPLSTTVADEQSLDLFSPPISQQCFSIVTLAGDLAIICM